MIAAPARVAARPGGFWEINTASHIDFPQQAGIVEIADNRDGTLSIFATIIDSAGPASYGGTLDGPGARLALSASWRSTTGRTATRTAGAMPPTATSNSSSPAPF